MEGYTTSPWNSLEIVKIVVGFLTPASVLFFGWFLNKKLKSLDLVLWRSQKLIDKRLELYDDIAPKLNLLYCFFMWRGNWKDTSPPIALKTKRDLDKVVNIYWHLLGRSFYDSYRSYIHTLFSTFTGPGQDAKLRTEVSCGEGDRTKDCNYDWNPQWSGYFVDREKCSSLEEVKKSYDHLMNCFKSSLGITNKAIG